MGIIRVQLPTVYRDMVSASYRRHPNNIPLYPQHILRPSAENERSSDLLKP